MATSRLRRALEPLTLDDDGRLRTVGGGYLLSVRQGELDADVFAERVRDGRRALENGDSSNAGVLAREALGLWRGPPFVDVAFEDFAQSEIRRLEEIHRGALEVRIDADLQRGRHAELISELEGLLAHAPTHERFAAQLMMALYRSGRQAEALEVYQRTRTHLTEELGLEPGPALRALQAQVLEQAPALLDGSLALTGEHPGPVARLTLVGQPESAIVSDLESTVRPPTRQVFEFGDLTREENQVSRRARALPLAPTPIVGREGDVEAIAALLIGDRPRLVTLTGSGGVGKTRLALAVGQALEREFADGVRWAELADLTCSADVVATVAAAVGVGRRPGESDRDALFRHLATKRLLLVIDNFEHVLDAGGLVAELLAATPCLRALVTSREPLHVAGEQQYEVPLLEREHAVELFATRASAVAPRANIDDDLAGEICERLDRLPLAIELTAARAKMLSPAEILDRLERRLPVRATGPRDAPQRQRTLEATADWSYDLLADNERQLFTRLSVFAGGCTLAAAEAVCDADLDTLGAVVDRSLIKTDGGRYWMLQTLREYALEKLARSGEEEQLRGRHARWYAELLQERAQQPEVRKEPPRILLGAERENFRAALEWAEQQGQIETVARLAVRLSWLWMEEGRFSEADRWVSIARERSSEYDLPLRAGVLSAARQLAQERRDYGLARELSEQSLAVYRELGDDDGIFWETLKQASMLGSLGDIAGRRAGVEAALQLARGHSTERVVDALIHLADVEIAENRLDRARTHGEEALTLASGEDSHRVTCLLLNLAHIANLEHRRQDAAELAQGALARSFAGGYRTLAAAAAIQLAWSLADRPPPERSARLLGAALEFFQQLGMGMDRDDMMSARAIRDALMAQRLDTTTLQAWIDEGRRMPLERAVRDELGSMD